MATYSTSLKLTLIGDGEQSGTWGQTTNTNLGTLLEQAITGVVTILHPDTATYTLTNLNGVSDEARNAVLVITGALTAQRDVIAPGVEKLYTIKNSTTGGYAIRIKTSGGTAVTVPNGAVTLVYCDGTDFYTQINSVVGPLSITSNATVGGTLGVTGALSGSTAVFSGAISSVSPSFTGTPTAPTAVIGTNTTQLATTAFVQGALGTLGTMASQNANNVNISGGTITGSYGLTAANVSGTVAVANGGTGATSAGVARTNLGLGSIATQDSSNVSITGGSVTGVTLSSASASFTGTPTAPTAAPGTNTTQIATTAFVQAAATALGLGTIASQNANNVNITGGSISGITLSAASPSFSGTPTAPTAAGGTNTTQIATTAFVQAATTALGLGTMSTQNANNVNITGGAINGTAIGASSPSTVTATSVSLGGGWVALVSGGKLVFQLSGVTRASLDSSGNFVVTGNVTAYGTP